MTAAKSKSTSRKSAKHTSRSAMTGRFAVKVEDSSVFINGKKVLVPPGKSSLGRKKIEQAVEKVVSQRKSA